MEAKELEPNGGSVYCPTPHPSLNCELVGVIVHPVALNFHHAMQWGLVILLCNSL